MQTVILSLGEILFAGRFPGCLVIRFLHEPWIPLNVPPFLDLC